MNNIIIAIATDNDGNQIYPPLLLSRTREEHQQMLIYSRDYHTTVGLLYRDNAGNLSSKAVVVDTLGTDTFVVQRQCEVRNNANGERVAEPANLLLQYDGIEAVAVLRRPRTAHS